MLFEVNFHFSFLSVIWFNFMIFQNTDCARRYLSSITLMRTSAILYS